MLDTEDSILVAFRLHKRGGRGGRRGGATFTKSLRIFAPGLSRHGRGPRLL